MHAQKSQTDRRSRAHVMTGGVRALTTGLKSVQSRAARQGRKVTSKLKATLQRVEPAKVNPVAVGGLPAKLAGQLPAKLLDAQDQGGWDMGNKSETASSHLNEASAKRNPKPMRSSKPKQYTQMLEGESERPPEEPEDEPAQEPTLSTELRKPLVDPVDFGFGMLTVDDPPECALPLMTVRFVKGPVSDAALARLFEAIEAVLALKIPFVALFDVRSCSLPGRAQISKLTTWAKVSWEPLETYLSSFAIVISSTLMRSTINMVMKVSRPRQPHGVFTKLADAEAFARKQRPRGPGAGSSAASARGATQHADGPRTPMVVTGGIDSGCGDVGRGEGDGEGGGEAALRERTARSPFRSPAATSSSRRALHPAVISVWSASPRGVPKGGLRGGPQPLSSADRPPNGPAPGSAGCSVGCGGALSGLMRRLAICGGGVGGAVEDGEPQVRHASLVPWHDGDRVGAVV